jgi:cysteine desulfurase
MTWWSRRQTSQPAKTGATQRIYLDYAAAAPMVPAAKAAMLPFLDETFANPGGIHTEGVAAKRAVEEFRRMVAMTLEVQPSGILFTSGGTESNNLAICGVVEALATAGRAYTSMTVVSTRLEHPATMQTLAHLAHKGVVIRYAPVTEQGVIDLAALRGLIDASVVLVTLAYVNSEIGAVTDCRAVRRLLDETALSTRRILLHVDAAQAPLWLPCSLSRLGADLMSLDGGKCGGGKGIGALAMGKGISLVPILHGGGQEMGMRPGTEPVHLIAAFATALAEAQQQWQARWTAVTAVRDYAFAQIATRIPTAIVNGPLADRRVANNVHISIPGIDAEFAVITLDVHGVAASTKSACSSKGGGASQVVLAMTGDETRAQSTLRFTLGPDTSQEDIDKMLQILTKHVTTNLASLRTIDK